MSEEWIDEDDAPVADRTWFEGASHYKNGVLQRTPEWHQARRNRVTGSVAGAILGLSPYMARADVMRAMVRAAHGAETEFTGNPATQWGTAMEATARADYEMDNGVKVDDAPFVPYEDWLGASPDGYVGDYGLVEFKCPYFIRNDLNPRFKTLDEQPHYYAQVQIELLVTGRLWLDFYQWTPYGQAQCRVMPDEAWRAENMPALAQFYAELLHERDNNADEHVLPRRATIDTPAAHKMVAEWDQLTDAIELATERRKDLLAEMVTAAGEKDATFAGRKLTLTRREGAISYGKAVKALLPDADLEKWRGKASESWGLR